MLKDGLLLIWELDINFRLTFFSLLVHSLQIILQDMLVKCWRQQASASLKKKVTVKLKLIKFGHVIIPPIIQSRDLFNKV